MKPTAFRAKHIITMSQERLAVAAASAHFGSASIPALHAHLAEPPPSELEDGVLIVQQDHILAVEPYAVFKRRAGIPLKDLGSVTLVPGLINCHSHLELSHLCGKTCLGKGFTAWLQDLIRQDRSPDAQAMQDAVASMRHTGTTHVADIACHAPYPAYQHLQAAGLSYHLLLECFGHMHDARFKEAPWPDEVQTLPPEVIDRHAMPAGHALYSTHPRMLTLAKAWCQAHNRPFSFHLAEHEGEVDMLLHGTGAFKNFLAERILPPDYTPPYRSPVAYAHALGLLETGVLAVHCVQCDTQDIRLLASSGAAVCLCPRSNDAIGTGRAPVEAFIHAGLLLCLGTDSLASNQDLNLWNEARTLRNHWGLAPKTLLSMLTVNGAQALGLSSLGALMPGMLARWAVVPDDFYCH